MKLKNRTSQGKKTFETISRILAENGARKVMFDYSGDGKTTSISFMIELDGKPIGFNLPAMIENVTEIMFGGKDRYGGKKKITELQKEQAYHTAWANVRDWIDAQMAMVATQQVKLEQVFLPYAVMPNGRTVFDNFSKDTTLLLN